eukprot:TRINITY_DN10269_c0_g1_i3.p1 TRINITY_DN10269_c0_g1~~TRINITY_DN10269_c0_g1_i3.p1  ORF type:complete len:655 (-),score=153.70 TRINITY_DN10269_c0_g1_i3:125-2035(-)
MADPAAASVAVVATPAAVPDESLVMVTITPPTGTDRQPADVVCVIDISGSMGANAPTQSAEGDVENHGLTVLDVVKHAVRTVISMLAASDRLSLVTFNNQSHVALALTAMNAAGKRRAEAVLDGLHHGGGTNLWGGLQGGLDVLQKGPRASALASLLLLTDGQPTDRPEGGHLGALRAYRDVHRSLACTIGTFGFGYNLNSQLLAELAAEGEGQFVFIPDAGLVGTAFIHATANMLAACARGMLLSLEPEPGTVLTEVLGDLPRQEASWGVNVPLGTLQPGQPRQVVLRMRIPPAGPYLTASLLSGGAVVSRMEGTLRAPVEQEVTVQVQRLAAVAALRAALTAPAVPAARTAVAAAGAAVAAMATQCSDVRLAGLATDLQGQATEALSRDDYYQRWGRHYLPSLLRAHELQQCNNFKDPGVQHYGGPLFQALRDEADELFLKLPPPKPSIRGATGPRDMSAFLNVSGGCFAGDCTVRLSDTSTVFVESLKKGDEVVTRRGIARIECVVQTLCPEGKMPLVTLPGGLRITAYHPVWYSDHWKFPIELGKPEVLPCSSVYTLVLDSQHNVVVNGTPCVTLGHGFTDNVCHHPYLGTTRVVKDLRCLPGWENGHVFLEQLDRGTDGLISGISASSVSA